MPSCRDHEGWGPVSQDREFDLGKCFEEGVLQSSFLVLALIFALYRLWIVVRIPNKTVTPQSRWILRAKLTLLTLAFGTSLSNAVYIVVSGDRVPVYQSYLLEPLAIAAFIPFTWANHMKTAASSSVLLLFWPAYTIVFSAWLRSRAFEITPIAILKGLAVVFGVVSFILECSGPEHVQEIIVEDPNHVPNPIEHANIFSIWTFGWMTPLMKKGSSKFITEEDLPSLLPQDSAGKLGEDLRIAMTTRTSLWASLFAAYGKPFFFAACLKLLQDALAFVQPQLLRWLLSYIAIYQSTRLREQDGPSPLEGFSIAFLMLIASMVQTFTLNQYFQLCFETGMRVRAGLVTAIYKKALVLSNSERGSSGDIVNLMSVDANRMQDLCTYGLILLSGPFQITLAFWSLYQLLGWSAFVGVAVMILSMPLNTAIARVLKRLQESQMKNRDKRTRLMSELLANIKSIKLYAWEFAFIRRILHTRNELELKTLKKIGLVNAASMTMWSGIPILVAFTSFAAYAVIPSNPPLTSERIFPAMSLFMLLNFPLAMIGQMTSAVIESMVSINRLSAFLKSEELQKDAVIVLADKKRLDTGDEVLNITKGEFAWTKDAREPTLEDINLVVKKGELHGIFGRVGAGKSSLCSAIVGEMLRVEGTVTLSGTVAYAPQNPWIMSTSVRDNILFSHEYDEPFYKLVIQACALEPDLALLKDGDMTEVGEKGITLSGGQRARVSLARAVYARADLTLLDDVLAAVDSHVARHVFDNVIGPHGLLASKARILVTNSIAFLKHFDQLAFIRRGIIIEAGSYESLMSTTEGEVAKLVRGHGSTSSSGTSTPFLTSGAATPRDEKLVDLASSEASSIVEKSLSRKQSFHRAPLAVAPAVRAKANEATKEHSEQGQVKRSVYIKYIEAASKTGFAMFLFMIILQQVTSIAANLVLRAWGESNRTSGENSAVFKYLLIYGGFSFTTTLCAGLSSVILWVFCSLRSAQKLHDAMLNAVMIAPLSFFETTPTGRILNLFSRDTYVVDQLLARVIQNLIRTMAVCVGISIVISVSFPPFMIAIPPLMWFYLRVMHYYLATSRELKRLDSTSKSPIFAWFSESLAGLSTIRAFNQEAVFIATNERRIDRNQICYLPSISVNRWLAVRLETVGSLIIYVTATLAVLALVTTGVDAGLVGLVLSYALNTTSSLNWVVRSASEVEQNIVSVERILHYVDLAPEAPQEIPEAKPPVHWPSKGEVEFKDYSTRYRPELEPVLRDVNMTIRPAQKIGICGRTGAGKSSLLLALFRIIEPTSGSIFIDGVDISKIGLHDLRSMISIVPQSPDLFEGTLRENIDPVMASSDADIWVALEQSHLAEYVRSLPEALDAKVTEAGLSLSSGQRQLLCFARALLRKSKILVLDEATSAVDLDTDKAIQQIIRGPIFAETTLFVIAHRLNTIIDSDRVMVLDAGRVAEFESPETLLADKSSIFYSLAAEAGLTK